MNDRPGGRDDQDSGQLTGGAAEVYEDFFVPALFGAWAAPVADALGLGPGLSLLDVACGTGVLAREAARRVVPGGRVVGLDRNAGMLAVARRIDPAVDWRSGQAEALPFPDGSFDAVGCQFGLMFFEDRVKALEEMWRVVKPGGRMAVTTWAAIEASPGYAAMLGLLERLFGSEVAAGLRAPYALGDAGELRDLLSTAGIGEARLETRPGTARFASIDAWVHTDVKGWTLADAIDDSQYAQLRAAARTELQPFVVEGGRVAFAAPAHLVTATKP